LNFILLRRVLKGSLAPANEGDGSGSVSVVRSSPSLSTSPPSTTSTLPTVAQPPPSLSSVSPSVANMVTAMPSPLFAAAAAVAASAQQTQETETPAAAKGLEMFLLQRAKALQHANPALKALVDLQGMNFLTLRFLLRILTDLSSLFFCSCSGRQTMVWGTSPWYGLSFFGSGS